LGTATVDWHPNILAQPAAENHLVLFYEQDQDLQDAVVDFIGAGLAAGEPVLAIATPEHRQAFRNKLEAKSFDVEAALASRQLGMFDAHETLAALMVHDRPDPQRFDRIIGGLLTRQLNGGRRLRVYGEMVDLLCRDGQSDAAIGLERLWNDLAKRHSFSLFCAYVMDNFQNDTDATVYSRLCDAHTAAFTAASLSEMHGRLSLIDDLRQRTRALESELERRKDADSFRLLVESVKDYAIFTLDPRGVVTRWNPGAERIKGYAPHEIIGQHFSRFYPAADIAAGKCERELEVAAAEGRFEDEGWRLRKDGTPFWANVVITALRRPDGELVGFAKVTRDLTERRKAEQERLRLAESQEANRVKDEFLATVSHELRTPLNAILGWATLLAQREIDAYTAKGLGTIVRNAEAQARLIEDMLDVSRIVMGRLRLDPQPANRVTIVCDAIDVVRPSAEARGLTIQCERFDEPVLLIADPARLQQIVWNLLSNAVKFSERAGVIFVRLAQDGSSIQLSVRDTGRGIEPDFLPYVFDRFRQADSSPARHVGGLGLGLAIVRHLVELHGGTVKAESAGTNHGATFTVTLPVRAVTPADGGAANGADEAEVTRLDGISVLVVDDEADARELIVAILAQRGAAVVGVGSPREARARLQSFRPQVIVCDVSMPGEDGYQFVQTIRQLPRDQGGDIPIVALTACAKVQDRRRAFDAGFNNHVPKPVNPEELASVIRNLANLNRR
jgi:PAS domain S-box-containing protein